MRVTSALARSFLGVGMGIAWTGLPELQEKVYLTLEGGIGMNAVVSFGWYAAAFLAPRLVPKYGKRVRLQTNKQTSNKQANKPTFKQTNNQAIKQSNNKNQQTKKRIACLQVVMKWLCFIVALGWTLIAIVPFRTEFIH